MLFFFNFSRLFHNPLVLSFPSSKFRQTSARDETLSSNELDLDVKVLVANTHISYLWQSGSRQKQRLLPHSQSLSAQVTHDLVQATNESEQRARKVMPSLLHVCDLGRHTGGVYGCRNQACPIGLMKTLLLSSSVTLCYVVDQALCSVQFKQVNVHWPPA